jgi:hypothetical protein
MPVEPVFKNHHNYPYFFLVVVMNRNTICFDTLEWLRSLAFHITTSGSLWFLDTFSHCIGDKAFLKCFMPEKAHLSILNTRNIVGKFFKCQDSIVDVETCYVLVGLEIKLWWRQEISLLHTYPDQTWGLPSLL